MGQSTTLLEAELCSLPSGRINVNVPLSKKARAIRFMENIGYTLWADYTEYRTDDAFDATFEPSD